MYYVGVMVYCIWVVLHQKNYNQLDNDRFINHRNGDSCWSELLLPSCGWEYASHIWSSTTGGNVLHCDNDWSVLCILYDVLGFAFSSSEPNRRRGSQVGQGKPCSKCFFTWDGIWSKITAKNWETKEIKTIWYLFVNIFYWFSSYNPQVCLLGYGAKLFRFKFGSCSSQGDASQENDVSSAESITGQKCNYFFP